jgi:23S rRNA (guanosine2251-2'-O)-methyltransferase
MIIYGLNAVLEALRAGRVRALRIGARSDARIGEIVRLASAAGVPVSRVDVCVLDEATGGAVHQGVVAEAAALPDCSVQDLLSAPRGPAPLVVVLDGVEDPHNLGAILRSVDAAGADGVIRQARHAAPPGLAAAKASAGAVAHVRIATVVNIARALEELREAGVWTVGLAGDAPVCYDQVDLTLPTAIVLGSEGTGLRRLVRERCEVLASIPMGGHVESLNVSVAAGVVLFEAVRQRRLAGRAASPGRLRSGPQGASA